MKVLLCLLSDQHVPNLLSVHHFSPDCLILVESTAMRAKQAASNFRRALRAGGMDYDDERCTILPLEDVNNLNAVRSCLQQAYGKYPSAEWTANVTGGMKPMSIAAYEFFKALGARVIYIDVAKPDLILGLDGGTQQQCQHKLSISEFVAGYGFEVSKSNEAIRQAEERAESWWPCARVIAQHAPDRDLLHITDQERKQARGRGLLLEPRHLTCLPTEVQASLQECFGLKDSNGSPTGNLNKYACKFLTGEWLEQFVWYLLNRHAKLLGMSDVHLGVEAKRGNAPTDFDIAFIRGYALGAVECKSGTQEHGNDPNAPLDKLEARMQQFRALRVNPLLVTTSKQIVDANGDLKSTFATRSSIYGCRLVTVKQLRALASQPEDGEFLRTTLFGGI
ncbi:MAG: DUF1887 family protein [Nitrospiraceae bacterium]|nr:DUF1887 family protein [Nitrospiraceae bacterium]